MGTSMNSLAKDFHIMWKKVSKYNQNRFSGLIVLTVVLSVFEAASLGTLFPFLTAVSVPQKIIDNEVLMAILGPLGLLNQTQIVTAATVLFIVVTLITGCFRFAVLKLQFSSAHLSSNDVAVAMFENTIDKEYVEISELNSSEIVSALTQKTTELINSALMPLLQLMSATLVFMVLVVGLLIIDWQLTLGLSATLGSTYGAFILFSRAKVSFVSRTQSSEYNVLIRLIQESFGGIRELILGNRKGTAKLEFHKTVSILRESQASLLFLAACPKLVIEVVVFVAIAIVAYVAFFDSGSLAMSLPTLGAAAYASQRLLPLMQQIYANILSIKGCKHLMQDLCKLLEEKPKAYRDETGSKDAMLFNKSIELRDISFKYPESNEFTLKEINLEICPGDRIGIFGKTGSGKSTLLDIIMGLLQPSEGEILCDGQTQLKINREAWYSIFSHVPQSIFLADTSVLNNIGGLDKSSVLDVTRAIKALELAHVREDIEKFSHGFDTIVGERGVRLSGGQLQRIGIARAIYDNSSILVLDEASSAIDTVIEEKIERSLNSMRKDITIIKVAHRISTLKGCNIIYKVEGGKIVQSGNYETFFAS